MKYELGLIGGGNMAEAIVRAVVGHGIVEAGKIIVSDPQEGRRAAMRSIGVVMTASNREVITESRQVMLATKPQVLGSIAEDLRALDAEQQIVLSIMAGVSAAKIEAVVGRAVRVVRVMPNTPLMIGRGMSAIALGGAAKDGDELLAMQVFRAAGEAVRVSEAEMDAVTAVSGSGPAYVFYLAEAMIAAAKELGLNDDLAKLMGTQTVLGAAELLKSTGEAPEELRRKVTSPGGTTQAAIEHLDATGVKQHVVAAIRRAAQRSAELGK